MKNALIIVSVLLTILALSLVSASVSDDDLRIDRIVIDNDYNIGETDDVVARVSLQNIGDMDLEDVRVTVTIPELGVRRSAGPFDLDKDDGVVRRLILEMAEDVPAGEYYVKIEARNKDYRRTKYRLVTVE
jgi:uncharacterized membrane protein